MKYRHIIVKTLFFASFFSVISCAGAARTALPLTGTADTPVPEEIPGEASIPEGLKNLDPDDIDFVPAEPPSLERLAGEVPRGVGLVTGRDTGAALSGEERTALSALYRAAYLDGLLREAPLAGVLGGDLVHGWPENEPGSWVQNWRSSAPAANSWGIPDLVLAVMGTEKTENAGGDVSGGEILKRVFTVEGNILDFYGKSAGINNANGEAGYGAPRGYEFPLNGGTAQRFGRGLIVTGPDGSGSFIPGIPPSALSETPPETGVFSGAPGGVSAPDSVRSAFADARKMTLDRGVKTMIPDGPGQYIALPENPEILPGAELKGLYVQSFNQENCLLILPDSPLLPPYPRFVGAPFLDVLLMSGKRSRPGDGGLAGPLLEGISRYGIPLTDPVLSNRALSGENPPEKQPAQRFSSGWLIAAPEKE